MAYGVDKGGWVYFMNNRPHGIIYTGVTADLIRRVHDHREGKIDGFTKKYGLKRLVYFERHDEIMPAITREKDIKHWRRADKVRLIMLENPNWDDLYDGLL